VNSNYLCISVRFLDDRYHGLLDRGGPPEWPPSPFRLFCALVAGAARGRLLDSAVGDALAWLQTLGPPLIIAPNAKSGRAITRFVPNNDGDEEPERQLRLTGKTVIPTLFLPDGNENPVIHYVWDIHGAADAPTERIQDAARSLTAFGWGTDMAFADARIFTGTEVRNLRGIRWHPKPGLVSKSGMLRVPVGGNREDSTLDDLRRCHTSSVTRVEHGLPLHTVIKPRVFERVFYTTQPDNCGRPVAAFEIHRTIEDQELNPGKSRFRPFHHVRRVACVAGMVRHAAAEVAEKSLGMLKDEVKTFVCGHGDDKGGQATTDYRLQFLPLPSLQPVVGVGGIRRVLIVGPPGFDIAPLRRVLNGAELIDEKTKQPVAMLSQIAATDPQLKSYVALATTWSTVTPVILPGHDDRKGLWRKYRELVNAGGASAEEQKSLLEKLDARVLALLWKAFAQAGWTPDALAGAELEYRTTGWLRGLDLARNYQLPPLDHLPRYHVRVRFRMPVRGPVAVGAGRYRGFGLFAAESG
jgi:CRISPR-associated protein Csb2